MLKRFPLRLGGLAVVAVMTTASAPSSPEPAPAAVTVTVFKDRNCGCCKEWVEHLKKHAFAVVARDTSDVTSVKRTARVPEGLYSCHTAFVNGYVVEGHVPAADIQRLLDEKPKIAGLAVPGMPVGSPGMEYGDRKDPYNVMAFTRDGGSTVFAKH
jgi:hypothetical protein